MSDENFVSVTTESGFSFGHVPIDDNLTATEYMIGMIAGLISQSFSSKSQNITSSQVNQQLSQITI